MRYVVLVVLMVLMAGGCERRERPAVARAVVAPPSPVVEKAAPTKELDPDDPAGFSKDMIGQLDRLTLMEAKHAGGYIAADVERLKKASGMNRDPQFAYMLSYDAQEDADKNGKVTFPMLKKNADRYAGRPWEVRGARIIEIAERNGVTIARLSVGGFDNILFVTGRFESDFVEGNRVDVVGFLAGNYSYQARIGELTIPALAAVPFFRAGGIEAMTSEYARQKNSSTKKIRPKPEAVEESPAATVEKLLTPSGPAPRQAAPLDPYK